MVALVREYGGTADGAGLFVYPIPAAERLESHFFITFHHRRWLNSDFRNLSDRDVRAVGFDLICVAQDQAPVGTLPVDERLLAKLTGESLDDWRRLCQRPVGPLYGWRQCVTDEGEVRLYHPVVLKIAQDALGLRDDHLDKKAADRERKRLKDLPSQIIRAGGSTRMAEDEALVVRLDQVLLDHFGGRQRRPGVVREALEWMATHDEGGLR